MMGQFGSIHRRAPWGREAVPRQHGERLLLRGPVTTHEYPALGVGRSAGGIIGGDEDAPVVKPDSAGQLHAGLRPPAAGRGRFLAGDRGGVVEHELGSRRTGFDPPARPGREHDPGHVGKRREPLDQPVALCCGKLDGPPPLELVDPGGGTRCLQSGDPIGKHHDARLENGPWLIEPLPLAAADEGRGERRLGRTPDGFVVVAAAAGQLVVVGPDEKGELPGAALVPGQ